MKMKKLSFCLALLALLALAGVFAVANSSTQGVQSADAMLGQAIHLEEVEGNLEAAIDAYKRFLSQYGANEPLAAAAQLHIGICYEKLGLREARIAYQTVIDKYPQQIEAVRAAKERISRLAGASETVVEKPRFRKIRTPFNIPLWSGSRLSPDGKTLAFGSGKGIWTVPIPGRTDPDLAGEPMELTGASDVLGDGLMWSGDGRWIAFSRAYVRAGTSTSRINFVPEGAYIDVIPSSGGQPKRIAVPQWIAAKGNTSRRLSLSPDGTTVAFDAGDQIFAASVDTGVIRQLTKEGGIAPCFSPDGTKIAYLTPAIYQDNPPARLHDVMVISADGTGSPCKINGDLNEYLSATGPIWSPDGQMIAFWRVIATVRPVRSEICIVALTQEGKSAGVPLQIELPLMPQSNLAGWTPDNKIGLLLTTPYHEYVYTVPVTGGKASQVSPLEGLAGIPRWSPDGKRIFFRWQGGGLASVPSEGGSVSAHPTIEAARKTGFFTSYPSGGNSVSPDGTTIVLAGGTATAGFLYTVPVDGGELSQIHSGGGYPCWSPNGGWIAFIGPDEAGKGEAIPAIFKMSPNGGEALKISSQSDNVVRAGIDWSPDGSWIAYFSKVPGASMGSLSVISAEGGSARLVCEVSDVSNQSDVSWSPDGQEIAFVSRGKIWVVPVSGGDPVEVKTDVDAAAGKLDWSPDGKKIAFSGESGMENEFWFMEDFLPLVKR